MINPLKILASLGVLILGFSLLGWLIFLAWISGSKEEMREAIKNMGDGKNKDRVRKKIRRNA